MNGLGGGPSLEPQTGDHGHPARTSAGTPREHGGHRRWMMIACCIPMLLIAGALVATGVVNARFLLFALLCTAMMALMTMGSHDHAGNHD